MKTIQFFLIILLSFSTIYAGLGDFSAMEDSIGNTIIAYRNKSVYLFNTENKIDTIILPCYSTPSSEIESFGARYYGIRFLNNDPKQYFALRFAWDIGGEYYGIYHSKYHGVLNSGWTELSSIMTSHYKDSLVYVNTKYTGKWYLSEDGGINWQSKDTGIKLISIDPYHINKLFGRDLSSGYLSLSQDNGTSSTIVMSRNIDYYCDDSNFFYDRDSSTIYFYDWDYNNSWDLIRSSDAGFKWEKVYTNSNFCRMCLDASKSGVVYLTNNDEIFISNDYGENYKSYCILDDECTFLYKKPNSEILFAGTDNIIYKISPDTLMIIKNISTSVDENITSNFPSKMMLKQNYPNPFNPITTIEYEIPSRSNVDLSIYNIQGRFVENLVSESKPAGFHSIKWDATNYSSGVYFYKIRIEGYELINKMLLVR